VLTFANDNKAKFSRPPMIRRFVAVLSGGSQTGP
jgi:hypothetical protein